MELTVRSLVATAWDRRHWLAVLLAGGASAGMVAAAFSPSLYSAESLLLVRPDAADAGASNIAGPRPVVQDGAVARAVETERQIAASDPVLRAALAAIGVPASDVDARLRKLRGRLTVDIPEGSNIVRVAVDDPRRDVAVAATRAIVDAYLARRRGVVADNAADLQSRERARYGAQLADVDARIAAIRTQAGVLDIAQDIALASARLNDVSARTDTARERLGAVSAQASAGRGLLAGTPAQVLDSNESTNARANDDTRNALARLELERRHVAEQYAPDWPGLAELDARIATARAAVAENARVRTTAVRQVRNPVADQLRQQTVALTLEGQGLARQLAELERQEGAARARVDALRDADRSLRALGRERDAIETIARQLTVNRASQGLRDEIAEDPASAVRLLQAATAPDTPRLRWPLLLLGGLILGIAAAGAATVLLTWRRRTFLLPEEVLLPRIPALDGIEVAGELPRALGVLGEADDAARTALAIGRAAVERLGRTAVIVDLSPAGTLRPPAESAPSGDTIRTRPGPVEGLRLLEDGADVPLRDPAHAGARIAHLIEQAGDRDTLVIVVGHDTTPLGRRIHPLVDGSLITVRLRATPAEAVADRRGAVSAAGGELLGAVVTGRPIHLPEMLRSWL